MKISIITASYNSERDIAGLINSLEALDDDNFEWVVADGGSVDASLEMIGQAHLARVTVLSGPDFGIYDALNKAVRAATGVYYLVLGADDVIYPDALRNFRRALATQASDFVAAAVVGGATVLKPGQGSYWRRGGNAYVASHAVGTLIRTALHDECGFYKNRYPNCADMYFILFCLRKKNKTINYAPFVAGAFGVAGISSVERSTSVTDAFRIARDLGAGFWGPAAVLAYRLLRFCR